jgi:hypothetical protein
MMIGRQSLRKGVATAATSDYIISDFNSKLRDWGNGYGSAGL